MADARSLFEGLTGALPDEQFETLVEGNGVRIERIVSWGQASPEGFWYDQPLDEWVMLISGAARVLIEGEGSVELRAGDYLHLAAHRRHRVEWTAPNQPTVWLAVHFRA